MPKRRNYGMAYNRPAALQVMQRISQGLQARPMMVLEVAAHANICRAHARRYLEHMHKKRLAYICEWTRAEVNGMRAYLRPVWTLGSKRNVDRPAALTSAQSQAMTRKRRKQSDPIGYLHDRKIDYVKSKQPRRDLAASWF